jgi:capsular polysaccharide biosynthesis protein
MELRDYWRIVRRRWWIPVALTLLVAGISAAQLRPWQSPPPSYTASLRLLVGVLPATKADTSLYDPRYYAWLTSEYLVDDFTEVVGSELFARAVNQRLAEQGIVIPTGLIQGSAATGKQHRLIRLSFTWSDPVQLEAIAAAAMAELSENTPVYFQQLGTPDVQVTLLDSPSVSPVGAGIRQRLEWPLRVILALIAGVGLLFVLDYLDTSVRRSDELEEMGLPVVGTIPKE